MPVIAFVTVDLVTAQYFFVTASTLFMYTAHIAVSYKLYLSMLVCDDQKLVIFMPCLVCFIMIFTTTK